MELRAFRRLREFLSRRGPAGGAGRIRPSPALCLEALEKRPPADVNDVLLSHQLRSEALHDVLLASRRAL